MIRIILICTGLLAFTCTNAQYKRAGETLQTRNKKNSTAASAANVDTSLLRGKWLMIEKKNRNTKEVVAITDTMYLDIQTATSLSLKEGVRTKLQSDYKISGDQMEISVQAFTILSLTAAQLVLDEQDDWIYTFKKVPYFTYETYGKDPVKTDPYSEEITPDLNAWKGNWSVFRREAKPGKVTSTMFLVKGFKVTETIVNAADIEVNIYNRDTSFTEKGRLTVQGGKLIVEAPHMHEQLEVYRQNSDELIFGRKDQLLYHCRKDN